MKLRSIIIDDENSNINLLKNILENDGSNLTAVVATSNNYLDAINKVNQFKPELIFLDIQLDIGTGFDLLEEIEDYDYTVVFVTAHEKYVKEAFQYHTSSYILKPIAKTQVLEATKSALRYYSEYKKINIEDINNSLKKIKYSKEKNFIEVFLSSQSTSNISHINCNSILYIKAQERTVMIYVENEDVLISLKPIEYFEKTLTTMGFLKINYQCIVNIKKIKEIQKSGGHCCYLTNGKKLTIINEAVNLLLEKLKH